MIDRSGCVLKAIKLLLSPASMTRCDDVAVQLLPWLLATSHHELSWTRLIIESPSVRSNALFHCIDDSTSRLLCQLAYHYCALCINP